MTDLILNSYLTKFQAEFDYPDSVKENNKLFEYFVNYCIISRLSFERFDFEEITTGSGGDLGIDGIAIIVKDNLIFTKEEVDDLRKKLGGRLEVTFVFIQSKKTSKFDGAAIGNFLFGIQSFFDDNLPEKTTQHIKNMRQLTTYIYSYAADFKKTARSATGNPSCYIYYVTTGKWNNDSHLIHRIQSGVENLKQMDILNHLKLNFNLLMPIC